MTQARRRVLAVLVVAGALALAGIVASSGAAQPGGGAPRRAADPTSGPTVRVVAPGRPGESATVLSPDEVRAPEPALYNAMDVWFVRMMIGHHAQALQMAALAGARAHNPQVNAVAGRITAAQAPEILRLRSWLHTRGLGESDESTAGHDHGSMRGMQSPAAVRALAAARGDGFDRMFVAMMSAHHQGAIDMATDVLKAGKDGEVEEIATATAAEQAAEISRMREAVAAVA